MKKKRKPVVAWAVVCRDEETRHKGPFISPSGAADEIYRTIYLKCGPHSVVKLVEQPKRARRK